MTKEQAEIIKKVEQLGFFSVRISKGTLTCKIYSFNAESLFKLSNILGTAKIEVKLETEGKGYCSTCEWYQAVANLTAYNVKL